MKREILCGLILLVLSFVIQGASARAVTPSPYSSLPVEPSAVFFTALQVNGALDYIEIYNSNSAPADLSGWKVTFSVAEADVVAGSCEIVLGDWLRPSGYGLVGEQSIIENDDNFLAFDIADCGLTVGTDTYVSEVNLIDNGVVRDRLTLSASHDNESWVRRTTTTTSNTLRRTGDFSYDFTAADSWSRRPQLYTGGWYNGPPADVAGLRILEILPNPRQCSPLETDPTCGDYVKLYNPTEYDINLADYQLRIGYQGQSIGINSSFTWGQEIMPELEEYILPAGEYFMLTTRNDGELLSITNSGGFVWLEDIYGALIYEDTVVEYPNATSTTKVGYSWAFDGKKWQWTMSPQPYAPNVFELPPPKPKAAGKTLVPCRPGQERNPDTNRCRSTASAASTLTPCKPGQERNPATNRCRSVAGASTTLKPCSAGQERNPETNRCRKIVASDEPKYPVLEDMPTDLSSNMGLWFAGAAGVGVVGYGAYEWRREIAGLLGKAKGIFSK